MDKHRKVNFFAVLFFLSLFCCFSIQGQEQKVAVNLKNASLKEVFSVIEKQTAYRFSYRSAAIDNRKDINVQKSGVSVTTVLDEALKGRDLEYKIVSSKMIVISNKVTNKAIPFTKQKRVSGVITDTKGEPIIGANVAVKGTSNGTITDIDGKFDIEVPANTTLKISYIGYQPMEINIGNKSTIDIKLSEDTQALDEIVVVGYGTQKKSDVSGSVTTVSGEKLAKIPTANAETALQGMAPGLSVNFGSGSAGSTGTLQVRGVTTWGTDNSPLVIIDGVPGDMSYLNPEDIKSMSVLKDAATAAIYGARAAAGVILIETNRGTVQAPRIQFSAYLGMDDLPKRMEVCNSAEFVKVRKMALSNAGIAESRWPKYISAYEKDPTQFADTDWQKEYYRRGLTQKYNVGYTSGNEVTNVALSTFYSKTDAIVIGTGDTKYGFRLNSDVKRGNFKMGESVSYSRWESDLEASSGFPSMYQVTNIEPLTFVYDKNNDGGYGGAIAGMGMSDAANVVGYNKLVENTAANDYIAASGYLQYEPIKDLVLKFKASRNIYFGSSRNFTPTYELGVMKVNNRASLYEERTKTMSDLLEFTANWNKTFLQKHSVQALFGMSQEENRYDGINASGKKFENNEMSLLGQAQEDFAIGGTKTRSGLRSVFGRLNYNYLMRYMIMASCRYDGSSRFADGNKWGVFPSVSAGWNIANEPFWET